jgi:FkbM family methyltransferase
MSELILRLADGTLIALPPSLQTISTYVLLEQEAWFEKEWGFVPRLLKPGMTVIDIGANVGVYSLALARALGGSGAVYAYEPASAPRALLERSCGLNGLHNLQVAAAALSDSTRQGHLVYGGSSELHMLGATGEGETISVTALDEEDRVRNWRAPDFVKIDAEGEEIRILEGGRNFFAQHSPLVMFEVKAGADLNREAIERFAAYGYAILRLLPVASMLVPVGLDDPVDTFELNLFAAKPDRLAALTPDILLAQHALNWAPDDFARGLALEAIYAHAFGVPMRELSPPPLTSSYRDALAGYALWRSPTASPSTRYAALRFSYATLRALCVADPTLPRLSTVARAAWDLGERDACLEALNRILALAGKTGELKEPFWPANPRFDTIPLGRDIGQWFFTAILEQLERTAQFSSMFAQPSINLEWLSNQSLAATEMLRRHMLRRLRAGQRLVVPERLCRPAPDHINADVWRAGLVPNTVRLQ